MIEIIAVLLVMLWVLLWMAFTIMGVSVQQEQQRVLRSLEYRIRALEEAIDND